MTTASSRLTPARANLLFALGLALATLGQECVAHAELVVRTRREGGLDAAQQLVAAGDGKRIMDAARRVLTGMDDEERRLLALRNADSRRSAERVLVVTTVARAVIVGLVVTAFLAYRREHRRRAAAEAGLLASHAELERRVAHRTTELARANDQLAGKLAELGRTEQEVRRLLAGADQSHRALLSVVADQQQVTAALRARAAIAALRRAQPGGDRHV